MQLLSLESKCKDFQVNISALREEISERDTVIAQNYTTIQLLRRRLADMEKHKFVLGYRTQVSHLSPAACAVSHLRSLSDFVCWFMLCFHAVSCYMQRLVVLRCSHCMLCKADMKTHISTHTLMIQPSAHSLHTPFTANQPSAATSHSPPCQATSKHCSRQPSAEQYKKIRLPPRAAEAAAADGCQFEPH